MNNQLDALDELNAQLPAEPPCAGAPDAFFDGVELIQSLDWIAKVCESCPALQACRAYGLEWEVHGIWGGLTPMQRLKLNPERQRSLRQSESRVNAR